MMHISPYHSRTTRGFQSLYKDQKDQPMLTAKKKKLRLTQKVLPSKDQLQSSSNLYLKTAMPVYEQQCKKIM